ncbi:MAG: class I tRNA ligase family protein, partial [Bacteroidota bacterium]|nr:class I tRNA ligase family protein [Bacteroidota bacterium]
MEYNFREIEQKWQRTWQEQGTYKVSNHSPKPKYYVLDMFPYPSGAGLHVGHPLGYIASDIFARFKRLKGFNVLHPMGYDAFGLPAEQYAIEHGIHPAESTQKNIANFRGQLDKIGFCFDWSREVNTSNPHYYKWTQWIFLQLFKSWYNKETNRAEPIETLIEQFEKDGNQAVNAQQSSVIFTADEWNGFTEKQQQDILMNYRLCYCGYGEVNWCEALGTVLANDEVINGVSERGGYPVVKKKLRQWYLRITDYADRLLKGLQAVDFSDAMKEMQSNWIGKSYGAEIDFAIHSERFDTEKDEQHRKLRVYTTRPDTIFGVDFMVISPEHPLIDLMTTDAQRNAVDEYIAYVKSRSERERMAEKKITGVFTGGYAINRFNNRQIPIWISEYVLAGYGTGAIMAVPCGDERDFKFAKHFNIPVTNIIGDSFNGEEANPTKEAKLTNSGFLNGTLLRDAIEVVISNLEQLGDGKRKVNYKMRDAAFSRQRYWGEPFPIVWNDGIAYPLDENELPLKLPYVEKYGAGPEGEGPLANVKEWVLIPNPSPEVEKGAFGTAAEEENKTGAANVPKYGVYTPVQYELAKMMRKEYTEAEGVLWQALRSNQLEVKFRRQHPIDAYIVDF